MTDTPTPDPLAEPPDEPTQPHDPIADESIETGERDPHDVAQQDAEHGVNTDEEKADADEAPGLEGQ